MASLEDLFTSCLLETSVPSVTVKYPPSDADIWLASLADTEVDRKQAFFGKSLQPHSSFQSLTLIIDEQLSTFLTVHIPVTPTETEPPENPPKDVLSLLTHVQVLLEASYISQVEQTPEPQAAFLSAPPRTASKGKLDLKGSHHPSIFPPSTPNPTPATVDGDRRYVRSEGTTFATKVWGEDTSQVPKESVTLLYSSKRQEWIAIYRMVLTVAFIPLPVPDPLLCLTMSTTLRQSPMTITQSDHPLRLYFSSIGAPNLLDPPAASENPRDSTAERHQLSSNEFSCFEEVNLLSGLAAGPSFGLPDRPELALPSTRLGPATRQELFSLSSKPMTLDLPTSSPSPTTNTSVNTLRKSFRKTMATASGFRVRMRTTFVPPILMSGEEDPPSQQPFEASSGERTVVLCIEVENSDDTNSATGFAVESVEVAVSGEGAIAHLITGRHDRISKDAENQTFPLLLQPNAQHNLLYAVSFLQSPDMDQIADGPTADAALRRAVVIDISGRPFYEVYSEISYPTASFSSRWNCVLDLASDHSPSIKIDPLDHSHPSAMFTSTFPEPASPFPAASPRHPPPISPRTVEQPALTSLVAGSKRHTVSGPLPSALKKVAIANYRASTSALQRRDPADNARTPPPLPSSAVTSSAFSPPLKYPGPGTPGPQSPPQHDFSNYQLGPSQVLTLPPSTPAYPLFTAQQANFPMSPMSQSPTHSSQRLGVLGPSIDIRREKGITNQGMAPSTPGPLVQPGFPAYDGYFELQQKQRGAESVVVSIGLLPSSSDDRDRKIVPFDYFSVDIFVYNQSMSTKRFEVCYPLRRKKGPSPGRGAVSPTVGILPLDNRVRIGPLLPGSCQSVRMQFVALLPGVHSLDTLTLTDVESDISTNLRSVVDVVVHDTRERTAST